jgi:hypothetical protein
MPIGQFYEIDVDNRVPFTVCGGLQDNGMWCIPSATRDRNGLSFVDAYNIGGGDGFHATFDPTDDNFVYIDSQNGGLARVNRVTRERQNIKPAGTYRWNWDTPIIVSAADPNVIYTAANVLFRSADRGTTWTAISPDLTAQIDPTTLEMMGAPVPPNALSRNDGSSPYGSMTSIGESPLDARVLYTGANDGTLQVTRDAGKTWTDITSKVTGLPPHTYVSTVLPSRYSPGRVYATFDGHYNDDYHAYVYVSDNFGQTWRSIAAGLPETSVNRLREHPHNANVLVVGHERGAHFSNDAGRTWTSLSLTTNFPTVSVDDAIIHPRDNALVLGTHGRGIWILDDAGPLEALTPSALRGDAVLAPIAPARIFATYSPQAWFGTGMFFAPNPDFDAGISYYLKNAASGPASIEIADQFGKVIRTLPGPAARGLNRARWDLRADPPAAPAAGAAPAPGGRGRGGGPTGTLVAPGKYRVTIRIPGVAQELTGVITVEPDPYKR